MFTLTPSARRAFTAAALAIALAGALLLPASPASATPVDGQVASFAYGKVAVDGPCSLNNGPVNKSKTFTPATGRRTATVSQVFTAADIKVTTEQGQVINATSGVADANNGAFNTVRFVVDHFVFVRNSSDVDCGFGMIADSEARAVLRVNRRGRVHLEWDRGRNGQIEYLIVRDTEQSRNVVNKVRPKAHGDLTFRVHPGVYNISAQLVTRINERDIPVGSERGKRAHFKVVADYRR